jgi:glycosyltransferase involved in cell wall biosynthesis
MKNKNIILVSVIVSTYNPWNYIFKAIDSILNQTYKNFEIIVIDDGSDKIDVKKLLKNYIDKWKIKYFKNKINKWLWINRDSWVEKASWEYLAFLDDDDEYLPRKLEKQVEIIKNWDYEIVGCNMIISYFNWAEVQRNHKNSCKENISIWDIINWKYTEFANLLIKKSIYEKIWWTSECSRFWEDLIFVLKMFLWNYKFYNIPISLYKYKIRKDSLTTSNIDEKRIKNIKTLMNIWLSVFDKYGIINWRKEIYFSHCLFLLSYNYYAWWKRLLALKCIFKAIKKHYKKFDYYILFWVILLPIPAKWFIKLRYKMIYN